MLPALNAMTKRHKTQAPYDWKVTLTTPQTFKTLLAIVEPTVANVPFRVCKDTREGNGAPFTGLRMDAMNSSHVCMVKAAYECTVEVSTTLRNELFCVDTDMLRNLLRDVQASHEVELTRFRDSASVTINTHDRTDPANRSISTIQLMDVDFEAADLDMPNLTFSYVVEIELERLKHVCRMVNSIRSNTIELVVDEAVSASDDKRNLFFTIAAQGEGATIRKVHHSTSVPVGGLHHIAVIHGTEADNADSDDLTEKFKGIFPIVYMNGVLKSMDRQTIQLYLGASIPLVMHYGLGNDMSYIKIILAHRDSDQ